MVYLKTNVAKSCKERYGSEKAADDTMKMRQCTSADFCYIFQCYSSHEQCIAVNKAAGAENILNSHITPPVLTEVPHFLC
jgi:hypothetical protein